MILDRSLELDPAFTAITAARDSFNVIDLANRRDIGIDMGIVLSVYTGPAAFTSGGAGTLQIIIQYSQDDSTYYDALLSPVYALADLTASQELFSVQLPERPRAMVRLNLMPRYIKLRHAVATANMTAGGVGAYLHLDAESRIAYPSGFTVTN